MNKQFLCQNISHMSSKCRHCCCKYFNIFVSLKWTNSLCVEMFNTCRRFVVVVVVVVVNIFFNIIFESNTNKQLMFQKKIRVIFLSLLSSWTLKKTYMSRCNYKCHHCVEREPKLTRHTFNFVSCVREFSNKIIACNIDTMTFNVQFWFVNKCFQIYFNFKHVNKTTKLINIFVSECHYDCTS